MSDDIYSDGQDPRPDELPGYSEAKPRSNRTLLAVIALVVVLFLAAAAIFLFTMGNSENDAPKGSGNVVSQTPQSAAAAAQPAAVEPKEPAQTPLTDVFTFRDIFDPVVKTTTPSEGGSGGGSGDGSGGGSGDGSSTTTSGTADGSTDGTSTVSLPENTLLLQDITVEDGEKTAIFVWNGATYATHEGDQIDDSPWQVLVIGDNSAVMLYGDTQIALSVGQAISK